MLLETIIAPSILAADFTRLKEEISNVLAAGADWIHLDIMDNHYVPNLTFGPSCCQAIRRLTKKTIDVHLMAKPVDSLISKFADAGADIITFHPEASEHVDRSLRLIRSYGLKCGLAFNPTTHVDGMLETVGPELDIILLMAVNPGFSGQTFIPYVLEKARRTRCLVDALNHEIRIEIDGGVNLSNVAKLAKSGIDTFVTGNALFSSISYSDTISAMRAEIANGRMESINRNTT